ncbi:S1 domain-containing post-transcriptional regulator GSP13 [Gracilibacillus sp. YIM 98692]|uniref:S1 domain-containing post-transcriptional regulator GSP13 n=1 Tax=Gracilibacillus sp. YIM 98692 TaxID=2663532 RepID=UPI0013D6D922|nr:S1 domain-containing post-transcriptional regulator GSP13 [Gracilibacillus sp. YIM 98692]
MSDKPEIGDVLEGVITGVQPYGAFVTINQDVQGLIHISELTDGYVKDIHDYVSEGDSVKVKVIEIHEEDQKYALSIRALETEKLSFKTNKHTIHPKEGENGFHTLKDKLAEWIKQSE